MIKPELKCPQCNSNNITVSPSNYTAVCRDCGEIWCAYYTEELKELGQQINILEMKVTDLFGLIGNNCPMTRYYKRILKDGRFVNVELSKEDLRQEIKIPQG